MRDARSAFPNGGVQVLDRLVESHPAVNASWLIAPMLIHRPVFAQVPEQGFHPLRALHRIGDELVRLLVELALVLPRKKLRIADDHAQRFLQVVGRRIGDMLEICIEPQQFLARFGDVLERQQEQRRDFLLLLDLSGVEQHHPLSEAGKIMLHL